MKENKITLFASNKTGRESSKLTYSCLIHCTGTYSDMIDSYKYFSAYFNKNISGNVMDVYNKFSEIDLKILNEYIFFVKKKMTFHINVKDISYYYFINFWINVLFKEITIENKSLLREMINDVYSKINKNQFISFIDVNTAPSFRLRENIYKKVMENVCTQIQASNVCNATIKKHSEKFVPLTDNTFAYIHKQSEPFKYFRLDLNHKKEFIKRESIRLTDENKTNRIYIDESYSFSPFVDYLQEQELDINIADSSFEEIKLMLIFFCNLFSLVFQKLDNLNNLNKSERRKLFYIAFNLFNLLDLNNLELEVSDEMFGKLFELSNNTMYSFKQ